MASKLVIVVISFFKDQANILAKVIPILIPVKDPGPETTIILSISSGSKEAS